MPTIVNLSRARNLRCSFPPTRKPDPGTIATYKELAFIFGVSDTRIIEIERRAIQKIRAEIEREAAAAGVSPEEWLTGIEP